MVGATFDAASQGCQTTGLPGTCTTHLCANTVSGTVIMHPAFSSAIVRDQAAFLELLIVCWVLLVIPSQTLHSTRHTVGLPSWSFRFHSKRQDVPTTVMGTVLAGSCAVYMFVTLAHAIPHLKHLTSRPNTPD
jgi:hypothetical protein